MLISCLAAAVLAGLIAYLMGKTICPFNFGSDITQNQRKVHDYFATDPRGVLGPESVLHPGTHFPMAWNGEDGYAGTVCP